MDVDLPYIKLKCVCLLVFILRDGLESSLSQEQTSDIGSQQTGVLVMSVRITNQQLNVNCPTQRITPALKRQLPKYG